MKGVALRQLALLRNSDRLQRVLTEMEQYQRKDHGRDKVAGPLEADPEYQLIVEANNLAADIDNEIGNF